MADVSAALKDWSSTTGSNSPAGSTTIGTGLNDNLQEIQGAVVRGLSHKGADIASATTTDLGAIEGLAHDITGTTTITGFGTVRAGIWKIIKFEDALTLTHNATSLILPGAANITTANGDIAIVQSEGSGNWRCAAYQKASGAAVIAAGAQWTITPSRSGNAETFTVTPITGASLRFRNATLTTGDYTDVAFSSAITLTLSSGSTIGAVNSTAFRVWLVAFNDAGTLRLGAVKTVSTTDIMTLRDDLLYSSTAEGGAGAADSAQVIYSTTAVTSKAIAILGYAEYSLATVGTWGTAPTKVQVFAAGVPLPGTTLQVRSNATGALATGTTVIPSDDTIPQNTEGDQYMSQAITPISAANVLLWNAQALVTYSVLGQIKVALFLDSIANAVQTSSSGIDSNNTERTITVRHLMLAGSTSAITGKVRAGANVAGTTTFNGAASGRLYGGVANSFMEVTEVMA